MWSFRLFLLLSFLSCYSISNYVPLLLLVAISQRASLSKRASCVIFWVLAVTFLVQFPSPLHITPRAAVTSLFGFFPHPSSFLSVLFHLFGKNTPAFSPFSLLTRLFFCVAMAALPFVRDDVVLSDESIPLSTTAVAGKGAFFLLLSKFPHFTPLTPRPVFYSLYYVILLLWVFLFPSVFSFPLVLLALVDLLLTRTSDRLITRQYIMTYLQSHTSPQDNQEGHQEDHHDGLVDMVLESLLERCVLLPNALWRLITLAYLFLLQLHSFFASVDVTYGISAPRWLLALFGNRLGAAYAHDKYIQLLLLCALYAYSLVATCGDVDA